MQFSVVALVAAFAAVSSAAYTNGTGAAYPTGTAAPSAGGAKPSSSIPFNNAAPAATGSALGLLVAGGVALLI